MIMEESIEDDINMNLDTSMIIRAIEGPDLKYPIKSKGIQIGRELSNNLVILDEHIALQHA